MSKAQKVGEMKLAATGGTGSNGVTSFWNDIERAQFPQVRAAWIHAGLDEKLLPAPPEPEPALRAALKVCGQAKAKVVKRPGKGQGFVLVDLKRFDDRNLPMANNRIVARVVGEDLILTTEGGAPSTDSDCERIRGEYAAIRREISRAQLSAWLTGLVESCEGIRLRDGGGLYWVKKSRVAEWSRYCEAIQDGTGARISRWPTYGSDDQVIADIIASFEEKVATRVATWHAEMAKSLSGEEVLGPEALENRAAAMGALLGEIAGFADEVGRPSARTIKVLSTAQRNLTEIMRYAEGKNAGRDMSAPVLLELDETVVKPKTAVEIAEEQAQDRGMARMSFIAAEVAEEIAAPPAPAPIAPPAKVEEVKPVAKPFRYTPPTVVENDAQANRFGLIELD